MNEERQILKDAAIKIVEDRIIEIGSKEKLLASSPKASVVGSKNFMLIPGLVNSHQHLTGDRLIQSCIPSSIEDTEACVFAKERSQMFVKFWGMLLSNYNLIAYTK